MDDIGYFDVVDSLGIFRWVGDIFGLLVYLRLFYLYIICERCRVFGLLKGGVFNSGRF